MAGISLTTYATFTALSDHWAIWDESITTDLCDWVAVALVKMRTGYIGGTIDATKDLGFLFIVGKKAAITPGIGFFSVQATLEAVENPSDPIFASNAPWYGKDESNKSERNNYYYWDSGYGSAGYGSLNVDYVFETMADFESAMDNNEIVQIKPYTYFDVYINGSDKPSLFVNWTAPDEVSPVLLSPKLWLGCDSLISLLPEFVTNDETHLQEPNIAAWWIDNMQTKSYAGSYETTYLSIMDVFEKFLNPASKVQLWGFDGTPACVRLYLRMDYNGEIGDLWRVEINVDGSYNASQIADSGNVNEYYTTVRFHAGEPDYIPPQDDADYAGGTNIDDDGFGRYDPNNIPDPDDFTTPEGFDGNGVLTTTYALSAAVLQNVGQKLWTQSYFDVLKIQSNPIENIVSVKHFPFSMSGTQQEIKVGDIPFGVNGDKVRSVQAMAIGSYTYAPYFKNFLDLAPFTTVKIFLPYCGMFQLDPADLMGCTLSVKYYVDLVTGQCMAKLILDEQLNGKAIPFMSVFGNMGVDIPLTSTDRVQTEIRATGAAISAMGSVAGHLLGGDALGAAVSGATGALNLAGADYTSQRTASQSPVCATYDTQDIFIMIERPASEYIDADTPTGYKHLHGLPSNKYRRLGSYPNGSFVQIDARTDLKIAMTSEENAMLEELLTRGVYI